jgi:hypothetical protein
MSKGLGRNPFVKKSEAKNLVGLCPYIIVIFYLEFLKYLLLKGAKGPV